VGGEVLMKLDAWTVQVLKNFSTINPSLLFREGNLLETISPGRTIRAAVRVTTSFPRQFAVYNLSKLISMITLFGVDSAELEFHDTYLTISSGSNTVKLTYADEATVVKPPESRGTPPVDVSVEITLDSMRLVERALGALSLTEIHVSGDGDGVYIRAADTKNPSADSFSVRVGDTTEIFNVVYRAENIKVIPMDYRLELTKPANGRSGISRFVADGVEYLVAIESTSTFG
jgi:hypothetical protein